MKRSNKKGFTIVELVIVIAVIAILTAVLIPTFGGLINKANVSADTALIKNLNTALSSDTDGCDTMSEALAVAAEFGYDVAKINAKASKNEILWDSVNNVFCYFDSEKGEEGDITYIPDYEAAKTTTDTDFWVIASTPSDKYSTYLYEYDGDGKEEISTGLDVGECYLEEITYTNSGDAHSVYIRTNNEFGKLTIDAKNDEVAHYGAIGDVNIIAVKMGSYNEFGAINGFATITYGKINVQGDGKIAAIIANPESADDVVLEVVSGGQVGAVFANTADIVDKLTVTGVKAAEVVENTTVFEELDSKVCYIKNATGTTYYENVQAAIDAASGETTIVLLKSILYPNVTKPVLTINAGKNIVLDLNGNVLEARLDNSKSVNLITVSGSTFGEDIYAQLTIKDSTAGADGIGYGELRTTELYNSDPMNVSASVISVNRNAKVTIESGKVINNNANCAYGAYAIDVLTNTGAQNAWLTVKGGLVESATYRAIRGFCNSTTGTVYITINGGTVRSGANHTIWLQNPSSSKIGRAVLTITGGTIESNGAGRNPLNIDSSTGFTKNITGGKFVQNGADVSSSYR